MDTRWQMTHVLCAGSICDNFCQTTVVWLHTHVFNICFYPLAMPNSHDGKRVEGL